jgi:hypothetical protein
MFKPQLVIAALALFIGVGLYETPRPSPPPSPPSPPPPPTPHEYTGQSSDKKPPADTATTTVTQQTLTEGNYTPPAKPTHDVTSQGDTKVDTKALTVFANNMDTLSGFLATSYTEVSAIKPVAAGAFPSAIKISKNVSTLSGDTTTALNNMVIALRDLRDAVKKIAADYHSTEDASKMTAEKLGTYTSDVTRATTAANSATH